MYCRVVPTSSRQHCGSANVFLLSFPLPTGYLRQDIYELGGNVRALREDTDVHRRDLRTVHWGLDNLSDTVHGLHQNSLASETQVQAPLSELLTTVKRLEAEPVRPVHEETDTVGAVVGRGGQLRKTGDAGVAAVRGGGEGEAGGQVGARGDVAGAGGELPCRLNAPRDLWQGTVEEGYGVDRMFRLEAAGPAARHSPALIELQSTLLLRRGIDMPFCLRVPSTNANFTEVSSGLCKGGLWDCFYSFHRPLLPALSAMTQQACSYGTVFILFYFVGNEFFFKSACCTSFGRLFIAKTAAYTDDAEDSLGVAR